jgi:uncharacterized protein (TIGR02996 family)
VDKEAPFLSAIKANPDDAVARLVYADWLEERGDARSEFLRLQVESDRMRGRLHELRQQLDPRWLATVVPRELHYNVAYHMECELLLRSGREITLKHLNQVMTYAGLLEGTPDHESNDLHIEYALEEAGRRGVAGVRPHLIVPPRRDYFRKPGDMRRITEYSPHWIPEWLPVVQCIGQFSSGVTARNPGMHISVLTVVWFQDEYAPPIQEPALGQLLDLDWEALALDIEL